MMHWIRKMRLKQMIAEGEISFDVAVMLEQMWAAERIYKSNSLPLVLAGGQCSGKTAAGAIATDYYNGKL